MEQAGAYMQAAPLPTANGTYYNTVDGLAPPPAMDALTSLRNSMSEPATPVQGYSTQMMETPEQAAQRSQQHQQQQQTQQQLLSEAQFMPNQSPGDQAGPASPAVRLVPPLSNVIPAQHYHHPEHQLQHGQDPRDSPSSAQLASSVPELSAQAAISYLPVSASIGTSGAPSATAVRPASATHTLQRHHPYAHPTHPHVIRPTVSTSALSTSSGSYGLQMSPLQTTSLPSSSMASTVPSPVTSIASAPLPHRVHSAPLQASPGDNASFGATEIVSPSPANALGPPFEARRQGFEASDARLQLSRASTPADSDFNIGHRPSASPVQAVRAVHLQTSLKPLDSPLPAMALLRNRLPILEAALSTSATDAGDEQEIWQGVEAAFVELSRVMRSRRDARRENAHHTQILQGPNQPTEAGLAAGHFLAAAPPPPPLLHANSSPEVPRLSQNSIMRAQQIDQMTNNASYLPSPASVSGTPLSVQMEQALLSPATAAPPTPQASKVEATPKQGDGMVSGRPLVDEPAEMQGQRQTPRHLDLSELRSNSAPTVGQVPTSFDPSASAALAHALHQQQLQQQQQAAPAGLLPAQQLHAPAFPSPLGQGIAPANIFPAGVVPAQAVDAHQVLHNAGPRAMEDNVGLGMLKAESGHPVGTLNPNDASALGISPSVRPSRSRATSNSGYVSASGSRSRAASGSGFQSLMETRSRAASSASSVYNHHEPVFDYDDGYDDDDDGADVDVEDLDVSSHGLRSSVGRHLVGVGPTMDNEFKETVDPIFEQFLVDLCCNCVYSHRVRLCYVLLTKANAVDATDSKGETIHQTLMAKKMERLDQSEDFRPFKFRIQAFTNAFIDLLVSKGFNEEMEVPVKRVRQYLWQHPYISRFNDDGRKAKSKGNHVWTVEAKKDSERKWIFREFERCIKGTVPGVAFVGLPWAWAPRVWDPQVAAETIEPVFSSPSLPPWLSWRNNILSGSAPEELAGREVEIVAIATCTDRGHTEQISTRFTLQIARTSNGMYDRDMLSDVHSSHPAATTAQASVVPAQSSYAASVGRISQTGSVVNSSPGTERSTPMHSPALRKTSFGSEQALQSGDLYSALGRNSEVGSNTAASAPTALPSSGNGNGHQMQSMAAAATDVYHMDEDITSQAPAAAEGGDSLMSDNNPIQQYDTGLEEFLHPV